MCRSCSGEQRTQSHPESCAACSRQRARMSTVVMRSPRLAAKLTPSSMRALTDSSRNIRVWQWGGLCRRIHASGEKNPILRFRSLQRFGLLQKYPAGAPVWGRRPVRWPCGQPAGCVGVQNAIARPRCWLKGCPTGCWPQSLEWSSSQWCSLVDAAATSTTSTPTANISMLVKHIDGGRGGRRPRATTCATRTLSAHRSKHRFCDG